MGNLRNQMAGEQIDEARCFNQYGKTFNRQVKTPLYATVTILRVGQDIDVRGAAAVVVVMVVVRVVAVVVDRLAGDVAQEPDQMPAPVLMAGVHAKAHVGKHIGDGQQHAAEISGCTFHRCKSKDK